MKILKIALISIALITINGCFDPKDTEIPSKVDAWKTDEQFKWALNKLSTDERELVLAYLVRTELGRVFGGQGIPEGTTLKVAIESQQEFRKQQLQKEKIEQQNKENELQEKFLQQKEEAEEISRIKDLISVRTQGVTWKKAEMRDGEFVSAHFLVNIGLRNKTQDDIAGVKGSLLFSNMFGESIAKINFTYDGGIPADRTVNLEITSDYNQFSDSDKALRNADFNKLSVEWTPHKLIFANGNTLVSKKYMLE